MSSTLLGDLVNGVFSESSSVSFSTFGASGTVSITVVQQEFGVTVAVSLCSLEIHSQVLYGQKFWRGIYFGGLAVFRAICQKPHSVMSSLLQNHSFHVY